MKISSFSLTEKDSLLESRRVIRTSRTMTWPKRLGQFICCSASRKAGFSSMLIETKTKSKPKSGNTLNWGQQYKFCSKRSMFVSIQGSSHPENLSVTGKSSTERSDEVFRFICDHILKYGSLDKNPRPHWVEKDGTKTPAHTYSVNNVTISYDILNGDLPLNTLRRTAWKNGEKEILWIYQLASNDLVVFDDLIGKNTWDQDHKIHNWWEPWALKDEDGNYILNEQGHPHIGACYGGSVAEHALMTNLLCEMERNPDSRRHIISLWQDVDFTKPHGLKPCVHKTQCMVRHGDGIDYLDASVDIRSWDYITAGAINQSQYFDFVDRIARHNNLTLASLRFSIGNIQIYDRHVPIATELCKRESIPMNPQLVYSTNETDFFKISAKDTKMEGYDGKSIDAKNPQIKNMPIAV